MSSFSTRLFTVLLLALSISAPQTGLASAQKLTQLSALTHAGGPSGSQRIASWEYVRDKDNTGLAQGWQNKASLPNSSRVSVPHTNDPYQQRYNGQLSWYGTTVALSPGRYRLRFQNVNYLASVWVNGVKVVDHVGGWVAFDTSAFVGKSRSRIVVRVDNRLGQAAKLGGVRQAAAGGWWNWGGLLRDVEIRKVTDIDVPTVRVNTTLAAKSALLSIDAVVANMTGVASIHNLHFNVNGKNLPSKAIRITGNGTALASASISVPRTRLWSVGKPNRMRLLVSNADGTPLWSGAIAARQLRVHGRHIEMNGRRLHIAGVSFHDHALGHGAAMTPADIDRVVGEILSLRVNVVRAHYMPDERLVDALDANGVLLWAEAPTSFLTSRHLRQSGVSANARRLTRETINTMSWRPSAALFSIGNEFDRSSIASLTNQMIAFQARTARMAHAMLRTSLITYASDARAVKDLTRICKQVPISMLGVNWYLGWYNGSRADAGAQFSREALSTMRTWRRACGKPLLISEFGAEGGNGANRATKGSRRYQATLDRAMLRMVRRSSPYVEGAMVWALRDFAVRPGWLGGNKDSRTTHPPINQKGLVTLSGRHKLAWGVTRKQLQLLRQGH